MATKEMKNRQAYFHYNIEEKFIAGIVLLGTEVKSIREGKVSFNDSFCILDRGECWVRALYISEYSHGNVNNHIPVHDRKLLLTKRELKKLQAATKEKGFTIIPLRVFFTEKNLVKVEIGLARGKKIHDKRETMKTRDTEREMRRFIK